jgi:glucose-1-phosphate thymidylyltransferase
VALIVGHLGEQIVDYVESRRDFVQVERIEQRERLGLGHAVSLAQPVVGDDPMLIVYGDTIFRADLAPVLAGTADGALGVQRVTDPARFGVVVERDGLVTRLVEKPTTFVSDLAIVGVNLIRKSGHLFACLRRLVAENRRTRGEYQLTDALQTMVEEGARLATFAVDGWFDCGTLEALLATNRALLHGCPPPGHVEDTVILPPVHVDPSARVRHCVLGPDVSIGAGAQVERVIGNNLIIGAQAVVANVLLEETVVGYEAIVQGRPGRVNVGDLSEVTM